ncbi:MAG: YifB family Mg chelatase-like AAA ATPase [Candidatus Pacebacteria bacterium]|nr:YifB family Mg chelatase-like AAA ATPase [Candidatus Paceibacterota bacterium]
MKKNLARVYSGELDGIDARLIEVEADINIGLHAFNIVGLADKSLNEARERVNSALKNSGVKPPNRENRKITINLAPADMKKNGSHYDLAIALGYLLATKQIKDFGTRDKIFLGELALDGRLRPVNGALNIAERAARAGFRYVFLPRRNASEAAVIKNIAVVPIETLDEAIGMLGGTMPLRREPYPERPKGILSDVPDFSEICGQENAKRALTIAAAGRHNVLFVGPPGVGKSFLARAAAGIMPALTIEEAIDVTKIWSAAGLCSNGLIRERPFRAPHQTISPVALIGGGQEPRPGEISLAHRGILFLDELPEFPRSTLEALRQPLESGVVRVARARGCSTFPARFVFVAAMNPCPCGYYGDPVKECKCSAYEVIKYQRRISGPLLDRIDLQIKVGRVDMGTLDEGEDRRTATIEIGRRVAGALTRQRERFLKEGGISFSKTNSEMGPREARHAVHLGKDARTFLAAVEKNDLSPRGYYRLLKVARTIADLEGEDSVSAEHLAEAFSYRLKEMW